MAHDSELGWKVHEHLVNLGIETPKRFHNPAEARDVHDVPDREEISNCFTDIMKNLGLDLTDDSLRDTPNRVAKMYIQEMFTGLEYSHFPKCTVVENKMKYDELVICRDIEIKSCCEHHWQPIIGKCHIGYIPKDKVLGLSKLNRVAQFFARRPQVQERLTMQIYEALNFILDTDVAVVIDAEHFCVKMRGVEDSCSSTVTSKMGNRFMSNMALRQEFLTLAKGS